MGPFRRQWLPYSPSRWGRRCSHRKTSISTAAESPTVLVGDDTDLLVLLCFYTRQDGCDPFFCPEPKSTSTQIKVWNIRRVWVAPCVITYCSCMRFLDVTQRLVSLELESQLLSRNSVTLATTVNKQGSLMQLMPAQMT